MRISVVIPCRNEAKHIGECVRALFNCDLPSQASLNVYVIDGMSNDGSIDIIKDLMRDFVSLQLIENERVFTPYAFNLGIKADPDADYILIVGARHILSSDYITKSIEILNSKRDVWCVGGRIINEFENHVSEVISLAMGSAFGVGLGNFRTLKQSGFTDTVTSPVYPGKVFEAIGYFDEELIRNQDDDFNFRISKAGGKIWYEQSICLKYYVRSGYRDLMRQYFQYGYWKVYVTRKHRTITTLRQLIPFLFVLYLLTLFISPVLGQSFAALYALPAVLYLLLSMGISYSKAKSIPVMFRLMLAFGILHTSYGLGYIKGILDFIILNKKPNETMKTLSR